MSRGIGSTHEILKSVVHLLVLLAYEHLQTPKASPDEHETILTASRLYPGELLDSYYSNLNINA
jgi:hypothetical protein